MAQETAAQFFKAVQQDHALKERLRATSHPEAFIKIAAQQGYNFNLEDLDQAISKLSPEEIAAVINPGVSPRRHIVPR